MKTPRALALLGACLLSVMGALSGCVNAPLSAPVVSERAIAFVDVNVVPMDSERVLTEQTVIVRNGLIAALGPTATITVPPDAERIDGRGRFLIPPLAHFQIPLHPHNP